MEQINLSTPALNALDIFTCRLSDNQVLLYAPLADRVAISGEDEVLRLENVAARGGRDDDLTILSQREVDILGIACPDTISELSILINQRCNFSCSYCYSANGRDNQELEIKRLCQILDWFIHAARGIELDIVFSGGGDPMLSFAILQSGIDFAIKKAQGENVKLNFGIVTNGSTLSDEQMDFIKKHEIGLVISFDILKEIQNVQRSHYDIVVGTIDRLIEKNIVSGIRSTITPLNVCRQEEMVEELHRRYPGIRSAAFEAVLNPDLFSSPQDLEQFYMDFEAHLFAAQDLGRRYGITIGNTVINNVDSCKVRACLGKLVVTPDGTITACSRLSSAKEYYFNEFAYGKVGVDRITFNREKYIRLMNENVNTDVACQSCIAKWHCSGGCLLARRSLSKEYFDCYCRFMRQMVVHALMNKLSES